jgi:hypothetical protein
MAQKKNSDLPVLQAGHAVLLEVPMRFPDVPELHE